MTPTPGLRSALLPAALAVCLLPSTASPQPPPDPGPANSLLRVFLDCEPWMCDFDHRIDLFARVEYRIVRGLNLDLEGGVARVKDQIYVSREDISDEDILLERRQLGTDFEYQLQIGFSFTFGSVLNNIVNPRMGSNRGRRFFR